MNWSDGLSWLAALQARRAQARSGELDRADMGTAFGLDASFGPVDAEMAAARSGPAPATPPWEHRLTRRSGL